MPPTAPVVVRAREGATIEGPAGGPLTPHCFQNVSEQPARILVLFTPSGMERFFDRFASLPAVDPSAFRTIGGEVGMEVVGPPLAGAR